MRPNAPVPPIVSLVLAFLTIQQHYHLQRKCSESERNDALSAFIAAFGEMQLGISSVLSETMSSTGCRDMRTTTTKQDPGKHIELNMMTVILHPGQPDVLLNKNLLLQVVDVGLSRP